MQLEDKVTRLDPEDGDCIVVTSSRPLSQDQRVAIATSLRKVIDHLGVKAVPVVLDEGLDLKIVRTSELDRSDAA